MGVVVINKFLIASVLMWTAPLAILYAFNHDLLPVVTSLSPHSCTLMSGLVAVISVNIVIAFYIYMAMKEHAHKHKPDPTFLAHAKTSASRLSGTANEASSQSLKKEH